MIWGVSAALHEEGVVDPRSGAFVNRDLAQYLVPVHADIPEIDAIMLDGFDDKANALGAKGIGELGICGVGRGGRERGVQRHRRARARLSRSRSRRCCPGYRCRRLNLHRPVSRTSPRSPMPRSGR